MLFPMRSLHWNESGHYTEVHCSMVFRGVGPLCLRVLFNRVLAPAQRRLGSGLCNRRGSESFRGRLSAALEYLLAGIALSWRETDQKQFLATHFLRSASEESALWTRALRRPDCSAGRDHV